jgi:hypothetical protein
MAICILFSVIGLLMHTAVSVARLLRGRTSDICGLQTGRWTLDSGPIDLEALLCRLIVLCLATDIWWAYISFLTSIQIKDNIIV